MDYLEHVRVLAYTNIHGLEPISDNPIESLLALDWDVAVSDEPIDQAGLLQANLTLEPTYCLGRAARAAAFVEKWFPSANLQYAEVLEDNLRNMMLDIIKQEPLQESMLTELLAYEDPHAVIVVDGVQFDPISVQLGMPVVHPKIGCHEVWQGFASDWLVENAKLATDHAEKLDLLEKAQQVCPDTAYLAEARAVIYMAMGKMTEAEYNLNKALEMRPTARSLFALTMLGSTESKSRFHQVYPAELFQLLQQEMEGYL